MRVRANKQKEALIKIHKIARVIFSVVHVLCCVPHHTMLLDYYSRYKPLITVVGLQHSCALQGCASFGMTDMFKIRETVHLCKLNTSHCNK